MRRSLVGIRWPGKDTLKGTGRGPVWIPSLIASLSVLAPVWVLVPPSPETLGVSLAFGWGRELMQTTYLISLLMVLRLLVVLRLGLGLGHVGLVICMALWGIVYWIGLV
jgi:hypothetical protein